MSTQTSNGRTVEAAAASGGHACTSPCSPDRLLPATSAARTPAILLDDKEKKFSLSSSSSLSPPNSFPSASTQCFPSAADVSYTRNRGEPRRGPGLAIRNPPGTSYRVGGVLLRRCIQYDAQGNAVLQVTAEPALRDSALAQPQEPPTPRRRVNAAKNRHEASADIGTVAIGECGGQEEATAEARSLSLAAAQREGQQQTNPSAALSMPIETLLSNLGITREQPTRLPHGGVSGGATGGVLEASEAERAYAREQDAFLAQVTETYPLLKVLPPAAVLQGQAFTQVPMLPSSMGCATSPMGGGDAGRGSVGLPIPMLTPLPADSAGVSSSVITIGAADMAAPISPSPLRAATVGSTSSAWLATASEADCNNSSPPTPSSSSANPLASFVVRMGNSADDGNTLRALAWGGCRPAVLRPAVWRLLFAYAPPSLARQRTELARKRRQYAGYTERYIDLAAMERYLLHGRGGDGAGSSSSRAGGRLPAYSAITFGNSNGSGGIGGSGRHANGDGHVSRAQTNANVSLPPQHGADDGVDGLAHLAPHERAILSQLALDLPRHRAAIFHCHRTVASIARSLFLWAQRHPAVGYVQGMDDIIAIFYQVFLVDALRQWRREQAEQQQHLLQSESMNDHCSNAHHAGGGATYHGMRKVGSEVSFSSVSSDARRGRKEDNTPTDSFSQFTNSSAAGQQLSEHQLSLFTTAALDAALKALPASYLLQVEADTYWCGGRMLALLQDNFMRGQPGIARAGAKLDAVVALADPSFSAYFASIGIGVKEVCFQWLHCMLVRELPLPFCLVLWDTYFCLDNEDVADFHAYVCAALVLSTRALMTTDAPMDVAMSALKNPYGYLFPRKQSADGSESSPSGTSKREREWIAMLIADAYRLWKTYPL